MTAIFFIRSLAKPVDKGKMAFSFS